jgi:hypothetical protein
LKGCVQGLVFHGKKGAQSSLVSEKKRRERERERFLGTRGTTEHVELRKDIKVGKFIENNHPTNIMLEDMLSLG